MHNRGTAYAEPVGATNAADPRWTKTADQIMEKVQRGRATLNAITN